MIIEIKDMKMPKSCGECIFGRDVVCEISRYGNSQIWYKGGKYSNCPLTENPEIIHCKDCKYSVDEYNDGDCYCHRPQKPLEYVGDWNFFCGAADRKEK